jgi:hypothetical protein
MGAVALDDILHAGRVIGPGEQVPDGPWIERLLRLGKVELVAAPKPKRTAKPKADA